MSPQDTPSVWSPILAPDAARERPARGRRNRRRAPRVPRRAAPAGTDLAPPGSLAGRRRRGAWPVSSPISIRSVPARGTTTWRCNCSSGRSRGRESCRRRPVSTAASPASPGRWSTCAAGCSSRMPDDDPGEEVASALVEHLDAQALAGAVRPHLGARRFRRLRPGAPRFPGRPGVPGAHRGPPGGDRGAAGRRPDHLAYRPGAADRARAGDVSGRELQPRRGPRRSGRDRRAGAGLRGRRGRPRDSWTAPSPGCSPRSCRRRRAPPSPTPSHRASSRGPPGSPGATATSVSPPRC